ncbi:uncharacterized protein F4807DRAFT_433754 [Annulohypoxylon truncatum]|uniref:uncharacterized protein n=1 Tax=Annulohypoxylon truncatum TaxID=327061 RepID=UPI00200831B5|nr:uncharacterized protein F4807DRAFT_433754 [Annulohypoxylon truncatum]KAI1207925.1 hypothetical protein F4807DRAFT_433754 [Annulohypoxylon truncatum]
MSLENGYGKKDSKQRTLVEIAASFQKKVSGVKGLDRTDDIQEFHTAIRKRLTNELVPEEEIIDILDQKNADYGKLLLEPGHSSRNIFHQVADRLSNSTEAGEEDKTVASRLFLQHLVISYPNVLTLHDDVDLTPLEVLAKKKKFIIFLIAGLVVPDETLSQLRRKCDKGVPKIRPNAALKQDASPKCDIKLHKILKTRFRKPGESDDVCLHQLIDEKKLADSDKILRQTLREIFLGDTSRDNRNTCLHHLLNDETIFTAEDAPRVVETFQRLIRLCPDSLMKVYDRDGLTPLHKAILLYKLDNFDFELLNTIIKELFMRLPESLYNNVQGNPRKVHYNKSPYALLEEMTPPSGFNVRGNKAKCHADIKRVLKYACIGGGRTREQMREYLYGEQENAPKLFLDLNYVSGGVNKKYLEMMSQKVNQTFETVLEYVKLPQIQQKPKHLLIAGSDSSAVASKASSVVGNEVLEEPNPYSQVFDWLHRKQGVEKIFNVIVDDLGDRSHSDEAIVKALKPFDVEVWDWRKFDMCSSTIQKAAPKVRRIFLHASGNNAVLRSWSCNRGLVQLKKLEEITITMYPDKRESIETLGEYLKDFHETFSKNRCDRQPKITILGLDDLSSSPPPLDRTVRPTNTGQQSEDAWITNLMPFQKALENWADDYDNDDKESYNEEDNNGDSGPRVKIALIDNGVNIRHREVGNITAGESFYDSSSPNGFRDFVADPSAHGTQMAICIRKVCPMAKLYVARLDDSKGQFTVASALKALQWATKMKVDIISMSWTFNQTRHPIEIERAAFKGAIEEASRNNILLFAALNDAEPDSDVANFYPVGLPDVFKIGSAKKWGANADFNQEGKSDYLFPGQEVALEDPDGETLHPSGSSLATAFAAGMAGLILYTMKLHLVSKDTEVPEQDRKKRLADAKTKIGMTKIFNILGENLPKNIPKDTPVAFQKNHFPHTISSLREERLRTIRTFLQRIAPPPIDI